jgi:leader peptidase (prepilin peptidase)/N-methyltransferase
MLLAVLPTIILAPVFIWALNNWIVMAANVENKPSKQINTRYALAAFLLICLAILGFFHMNVNHASNLTLPLDIFIPVLIALAIIDAITGYLPDLFTIPLLVLGVILHILGKWFLTESFFSDPIASIAGVALAYGGFWLANQIHLKMAGIDGLGMGDAKLLAAIGAWFGPLNLIPVVAIASGAFLVVALVAWLWSKVGERERIRQGATFPFGPYLAAGALGTLLIQ